MKATHVLLFVVLCATTIHAYNCAELSCSECTANDECGWCEGASIPCRVGTQNQAVTGACQAGGASWFWSKCPSSDCSTATSCSACSKLTGCGWCSEGQGSCQAGSSARPFDVCPSQSWKYDTCDAETPVLVAAVLSQSGSSLALKVHPGVLLDSVSSACASIISDVSTLGTGVQCHWRDPSTFVVALGTGATVAPGDGITVASNTLTGAGGAATAAQQVTLRANDVLLTPRPAIEGPNTVTPCQAQLTLSGAASQGSGGRAFTVYQWSVVGLSNANDTGPTNGPTLSLNLSGLADGASVTVSLTVTNWLGVSDTVTHVVSMVRRAVVPLNAVGPSTVYVRAANTLKLSSRATRFLFDPTDPTDCNTERTGVPLSYSWSRVGGPVLTLDPASSITNSLFLPASTLLGSSPFTTYTLELRSRLGESVSTIASDRVTLRATSSPLLAQPRGVRAVTRLQTLVLDASATLDPDAVDAASTYAWDCRQLESPERGCVVSGFLSGATPTFAVSNLEPGEWIFYVVVTKGSRRAKASLQVRVFWEDSPVGQIRVLDLDNTVVPGEAVPSYARLVLEGNVLPFKPSAPIATYAWVCDQCHGSQATTVVGAEPVVATPSPTVATTATPTTAATPSPSSSGNSTRRAVHATRAAVPVPGSSRYLQFEEGSLLPNRRYRVSLLATDTTGSTVVVPYDFVTNEPPRAGTCSVTTSPAIAGGAFQATAAGTARTTFVATCSGWLDDGAHYPLSYEFFYTTSDGARVSLDPGPSVASSLDFSLPRNAVSIVARVRDSLGDGVDVVVSQGLTGDATGWPGDDADTESQLVYIEALVDNFVQTQYELGIVSFIDYATQAVFDLLSNVQPTTEAPTPAATPSPTAAATGTPTAAPTAAPTSAAGANATKARQQEQGETWPEARIVVSRHDWLSGRRNVEEAERARAVFQAALQNYNTFYVAQATPAWLQHQADVLALAAQGARLFGDGSTQALLLQSCLDALAAAPASQSDTVSDLLRTLSGVLASDGDGFGFPELGPTLGDRTVALGKLLVAQLAQATVSQSAEQRTLTSDRVTLSLRVDAYDDTVTAEPPAAFSFVTHGGLTHSITLPASLQASWSGERVVSGVAYSHSSLYGYAPNTTQAYSDAVEFLVTEKDGTEVPVQQLEDPVVLTFELPANLTSTQTVSCAFWDGASGRWSTEGCRVLAFGVRNIECACTHLSTFAVRAAGLIGPGPQSTVAPGESSPLVDKPWLIPLLLVVSLLLLLVLLFGAKRMRRTRSHVLLADAPDHHEGQVLAAELDEEASEHLNEPTMAAPRADVPPDAYLVVYRPPSSDEEALGEDEDSSSVELADVPEGPQPHFVGGAPDAFLVSGSNVLAVTRNLDAIMSQTFSPSDLPDANKGKRDA